MRTHLFYIVVALLVFFIATDKASADPAVETFFRKGGNHTNNWAVIVSTSRFWFNYRHSANALGIYRTLKRLGLGDDRIILMLADDHSCDARNPYPGQIFNGFGKSASQFSLNIYGDQIEVDYRGYEVTVESFIRLLTGRLDEDVPQRKRLMSDSGSNILIYMTGHGGNEFIKFQDTEEISSQDIADAIQQMHLKSRYNEIFFMVDTCQAATLYNRFYSPNVLSIGSSLKGENSYSHSHSEEIGQSVIDRFTHYTLSYFERYVRPDSSSTLYDLFSTYDKNLLASTPHWATHLYKRPINKVFLTEFFGSHTPVELTTDTIPL